MEVAPEVIEESNLFDESQLMEDDDIGRDHSTAESSGVNVPNNPNDIEMGNVIYSITADTKLRDKLELWEHKFKQQSQQSWDDEVKKMNVALAKEGFEHSIVEIYSPKRVNGIGNLLGLAPGMSLDLTELDIDGQPWDFNVPEKCARAEKLVRDKKALLLIGSPMCSAFSQIQGLNFSKMDAADVQKVIAYGTKHLEFCLKLYKLQHDNGLYFLHEHPWGAKSWDNLLVKQMLELPDIVKVKSHMCAFGMNDSDHQGGGLVKKPTGFMTNAIKLAERLEQPCSGDHRHVLLLGGGRARRAQIYPDELCREIIYGLHRQMIYDGRIGHDMIGAVDKIDEAKIDMQNYTDATFYDDVSGKELPKQLTIRARETELEYIRSMKLWSKVPIKECYEKTGAAPIGVKWIEVNKGDDLNPNIRARLVAQEFNQGKLSTIFAATPPLEAKKALMSMAVTEGIGYGAGWSYKLDFIDIKRAYFNAPAKRDVYVKLPMEQADEGYCAKLNKSMYGTRDASLNWECEYIRFMESVGFKRGLSSPCLFYHEAKDLRAVIYGDDFTLLGAEHHLDWFKTEIKQVYGIEFKARLGPDDGDDKSVRLLNRIVEWTHEGINIEADQRHAEIIVRELGLENAVPLSSPPVDKINPKNLSDDDLAELVGKDATSFRAMVARANYLSIDRSDIRFTVKELARKMSKPRQIDYERLMHLGRYLRGKMRVVNKFAYQKNYKIIDIWSDTDHAGCMETRKSTTGGVIMFGEHALKHWSSTQSLISLSSGEAEYYGCVRAGSQGLGIKSMLGDLGVKGKRLRIKTDASVARSLASRRGLGGIRHIEVNQLWLQEKVNTGDIEVEKVKGEINRADALTKPKDGPRLKQHLEWTNQKLEYGRHDLAPKLATGDPLEEYTFEENEEEQI